MRVVLVSGGVISGVGKGTDGPLHLALAPKERAVIHSNHL